MRSAFLSVQLCESVDSAGVNGLYQQPVNATFFNIICLESHSLTPSLFYAQKNCQNRWTNNKVNTNTTKLNKFEHFSFSR